MLNRRRGYSLFSLIFILFFSLPHSGSAQSAADTVILTVPKAEEIFLQKNLTLLAAHYNIDINSALIRQAKVWDNPVLNTDQNIFDGKWFRHTNENGQAYGQVYLQVMQLIRTAGKIRKQTRMAEDNLSGAEAQFADVMRNLRFTLSTDMNELARLQNTASVYQNELATMESLVRGMDEMYRQGDVSQKENIRIKALMFSLQNDYNDNIRRQFDIQKELGILLQLPDSVWIRSDAATVLPGEQINEMVLAAVKDTAISSRPDLNMIRAQNQFQVHNLALQNALKYPDLNTGVEYDKLNSYVPNYWGLYISLPLPVFNRNKGNISAAEFAVKQTQLQVDQLSSQVDKEVGTAWQKLSNATAMLSKSNALLQDNYDTLLKNMVSSYRQRQVGLIEFVDFFDSYRETRTRQWQLVTDQRNAAAELNYVANRNIIKL
ncbi:MAG TPA: TolC family protein [Chitinophagaceae bacterium]|nr:TolC family protein [Chitinophagaceae bacterium]